MKKTYKIDVPKNITAKVLETVVNDDSIDVKVDLKCKFKKGDFLVCETTNQKFIFIFKYIREGWISTYVNLKEDETYPVLNIKSRLHESCGNFRYATTEEQKCLLNKLKNIYGFEWSYKYNTLITRRFQFGDIVRVYFDTKNAWYLKRNYMVCIYPDNKESAIIPSSDYFFNIANIDLNGDFNTKCSNDNVIHITYAMTSDIEELFNKLKENNLEWDSEKKILKSLKWEPQIGEKFYYVGTDGKIYFDRIREYDYVSSLLRIGNCFRTEEEAKPYVEKMLNVFK